MKPLVQFLIVFFLLLQWSCKEEGKGGPVAKPLEGTVRIAHAKGFSINPVSEDLTVMTLHSPWPNAERPLRYALVTKEKMGGLALEIGDFDAIVPVPVETYVATSTTHIPALESLGVLEGMVGFPGTEYISSKKARALVASGHIADIGQNEALNTEMTMALQPSVVFGFGINASNTVYHSLATARIPIVFNGDWTEESPLGKAEWIKFFAPFFKKEALAEAIFKQIETDYQEAKALAKTSSKRPTVLSGALYKDVWYLPGGESWAAQFLADAQADYIFSDQAQQGSLALGWEHVLLRGKEADYWIGPAQFTSYEAMEKASPHYAQFTAFKNRTVFTFAKTVGETGGVLYYELAPNRPDRVLKDLIHIFHPQLLPNYEPMFFKPLSP